MFTEGNSGTDTRWWGFHGIPARWQHRQTFQGFTAAGAKAQGRGDLGTVSVGCLEAAGRDVAGKAGLSRAREGPDFYLTEFVSRGTAQAELCLTVFT